MARNIDRGGTSGAARRGRPRSAVTTRAVLESAYALMATAGLAETTIDAVARRSAVSKMTIYKWWPSREALLIDAFLHQAETMLPLPDTGPPLVRMRRHAAAYADALRGDFGRVQLAVVAECIAQTGSAEIFHARYLTLRRTALVDIIREGQEDGSICVKARPEDLYDAIYGGLFYRSVFTIAPLTATHARRLVDLILRADGKAHARR